MKNDWLKINGMHDGATSKIFEFASKLRINMTEPEKEMWKYLKTKPLGFKFRRQHPIDKYVLDFYCHKIRLSIEIDGQNHETIEQKFSDQKRTSYLNGLGIKELRFKNENVLFYIDQIKLKLNLELRLDSL